MTLCSLFFSSCFHNRYHESRDYSCQHSVVQAAFTPMMRSLDFVNGAAIQELDHDPPTPQPLKAPIDLAQIEARREALLRRKQSTPYCRQKSSLEKEPASFLQNLWPPRYLQTATPDDVVNFLIWKAVVGGKKVHLDSCPAFGTKNLF